MIRARVSRSAHDFLASDPMNEESAGRRMDLIERVVGKTGGCPLCGAAVSGGSITWTDFLCGARVATSERDNPFLMISCRGEEPKVSDRDGTSVRRACWSSPTAT